MFRTFCCDKLCVVYKLKRFIHNPYKRKLPETFVTPVSNSSIWHDALPFLRDFAISTTLARSPNHKTHNVYLQKLAAAHGDGKQFIDF